MVRVAWVGFTVLSLAFAAKAEVLLLDSFTYTNGPLINVSGGKWRHHSPASSGTGQVNVASGRVVLTGSDTEDVNAPLVGEPYRGGTTNRFYSSFTVRVSSLPSSGGSYFAHFKDTGTTTFRGRIWALTAGATPGKFRLGISSVTSTVNAIHPTDLSLNTDYTVVTRLVNTNSSAALWISPAAETDPAISSDDGSAAFTVSAYAFRQGSGIGGMSIDDLRVGTTFRDVVTNAPLIEPPTISSAPVNAAATHGTDLTLAVAVEGAEPLWFQWRFNGAELHGANDSSLTLSNVSFAQSGFYSVIVTNSIGTAISEPVTVNVFAARSPAFSLLSYNLHGNGITNWSTNAFRVRAIGRQVQHLRPDIITFQEIPVTNNGLAQMTNFVSAFLPGYNLATNSISDGFIQSVIISRYPILASRSWLHASSLDAYGYTNSGFTRDLFEAEIAIPDFSQPVHIFTAHLKSGQDSDASARRAAEAAAISNFLVKDFLPSRPWRPYLLTGDFNEDLMRPPSSEPESVQRLANPATGLQLTTPFEPVTRNELTFSIQSLPLTKRYDYVLPCELLFSHMVTNQIFRTDVLSPVPSGVNANDGMAASDHLLLFFAFANPYDNPFQVLSLLPAGEDASLTWDSVPGQTYCVEMSTNLTAWFSFADNLLATNQVSHLNVSGAGNPSFFRVRRVP